MEPRRNRADARWFLHAQGHTLGPYDDLQVIQGLKEGEILPSDKIYSAKDKSWTILASHPYFKSRPDLLAFRRADQIPSPPSPRSLRAKAAVVPPPIPPLPRKPIREPVRELASLPASEPALLPVPPPAKVGRAPKAPRVPKLAAEILSPMPEPKPATPSVTLATDLAQPPLPEEKGLLEPVPIGPGELFRVEPLTPWPMAPEEIFEEENLEDMAHALERALEEPPVVSVAPAMAAQIPPRPEINPVFLAEPGSWARPPKSVHEMPRVIQIHLKIPERAKAKLAAFVLVALLAAGAGYLLSDKNKTRDQKDFRLSDPPSPIAVPLEAVDPNPPLMAPTRPQRE
jgi:hypothetical protein